MHLSNLKTNMGESVGEWKADMEIPTGVTLESSEDYLEGENKRMFMAFMRGMLQWRPEDRKTARELLKDPWLNGNFSSQ